MHSHVSSLFDHLPLLHQTLMCYRSKLAPALSSYWTYSVAVATACSQQLQQLERCAHNDGLSISFEFRRLLSENLITLLLHSEHIQSMEANDHFSSYCLWERHLKAYQVVNNFACFILITKIDKSAVLVCWLATIILANSSGYCHSILAIFYSHRSDFRINPDEINF
jgi:hypothetical protein